MYLSKYVAMVCKLMVLQRGNIIISSFPCHTMRTFHIYVLLSHVMAGLSHFTIQTVMWFSPNYITSQKVWIPDKTHIFCWLWRIAFSLMREAVVFVIVFDTDIQTTWLFGYTNTFYKSTHIIFGLPIAGLCDHLLMNVIKESHCQCLQHN